MSKKVNKSKYRVLYLAFSGEWVLEGTFTSIPEAVLRAQLWLEEGHAVMVELTVVS